MLAKPIRAEPYPQPINVIKLDSTRLLPLLSQNLTVTRLPLQHVVSVPANCCSQGSRPFVLPHHSNAYSFLFYQSFLAKFSRAPAGPDGEMRGAYGLGASETASNGIERRVVFRISSSMVRWHVVWGVGYER